MATIRQGTSKFQGRLTSLLIGIVGLDIRHLFDIRELNKHVFAESVAFTLSSSAVIADSAISVYDEQ